MTKSGLRSTWAKDNRRDYLAVKQRNMKYDYNLTHQEWNAIFEAQGRVCAICKSSEPKHKFGWHTDHNHTTMIVRGILCHSCNTLVGWIERHGHLLEKIDAYLQKGELANV